MNFRKWTPVEKTRVLLFVAAPLTGALLASSTLGWIELSDAGQTEVRQAKEELLATEGLLRLHHAVHSQVGEEVWESRVKPDFMAALTRNAILETGDPFPDWKTVVGWARKNPAEACRLMREAAERARPGTKDLSLRPRLPSMIK